MSHLSPSSENEQAVTNAAKNVGSERPGVWTSDEECYREVWKHAIDLQKHFNDILFKVRAFYFGFLGIIGTAVAAILFSNSGGDALARFPVGLKRLFLTVLLVAPGVAVWMLDRYYYHPLLVGAVKLAARVEEIVPRLMSVSTTLRIENHSAKFFSVSRGRAKVTLFYGWITVAIVALLNADCWWIATLSGVVVGAVFWALECSERWWPKWVRDFKEL